MGLEIHASVERLFLPTTSTDFTPHDLYDDCDTPTEDLLHQATLQQKTGEVQICDLPRAQEDVGELCKTRPLAISLLYTTLHLDELTDPSELLATKNAIQSQHQWESNLSKWFELNGYKATESSLVTTGPYTYYYHRLETFTDHVVHLRIIFLCVFNSADGLGYKLTFSPGRYLKRKWATAFPPDHGEMP
ncbi:hypothetical protein F66182_6763 [Fusarium sp. NRRL 66182]|nr:hypothetical protein F66182_6763 [Fusarium sp. NRRL 66182]